MRDALHKAFFTTFATRRGLFQLLLWMVIMFAASTLPFWRFCLVWIAVFALTLANFWEGMDR